MCVIFNGRYNILLKKKKIITKNNHCKRQNKSILLLTNKIIYELCKNSGNCDMV